MKTKTISLHSTHKRKHEIILYDSEHLKMAQRSMLSKRLSQLAQKLRKGIIYDLHTN